MKPKNQRLVLLSAAIVAVLAAVLLAMLGLKDRAAYFYTPADIAAGKADPDRAMRLGGMVERGSLKQARDGTILFRVFDGDARTPVQFRGILPNLFREGSGVVAEGRFQPDGRFVADEILAKHDENYMPPKLAGERHKTETLK